MFVTNWISSTKIQKISEITNFFRHYFLSRTEVYYSPMDWQEPAYEKGGASSHDRLMPPPNDMESFKCLNS